MSNANSNKKPCILTVDDDRVTLCILAIGMRNAGYDVIQADSAEEAMHLIATVTPDLALLDISMPGMSGIELARHLRENTTIPFMFLSSLTDLDTVRQATLNGAIGYLVKPIEVTQIIPATEASLARARELAQLRDKRIQMAAELVDKHEVIEGLQSVNDIQEKLVAQHIAQLSDTNNLLDKVQSDLDKLRVNQRILTRMANEDSLTGLPNRNWLMNYVPGALAQAKKNDAMLALLFVDLDGFKVVNDTWGHPAGDDLLHAAAVRMKSVLRANNHLVRIGGDEFVVIVEKVIHANDAAEIAERLVEALFNPFELADGMSQIGATIGISLFPVDGGDVDSLLKNADTAMYHAKSLGKNRHYFYQRELGTGVASLPEIMQPPASIAP
ncbi:MAG: diguanylate cyclase [Pseudomonadota bacterium]